MIFLSCLILFLAACLGLDWLFAPKCDRHQKKVINSRVPGLGCWECWHEDVEEYPQQHPGAGE